MINNWEGMEFECSAQDTDALVTDNSGGQGWDEALFWLAERFSAIEGLVERYSTEKR